MLGWTEEEIWNAQSRIGWFTAEFQKRFLPNKSEVPRCESTGECVCVCVCVCVCGRIYLLRPSLFWDVTRRRSVAAYRRFGRPNGTNFKRLPSHIDLLFFIPFPYSTNLLFLFTLLHSLILCLLYPPVYLHSSFPPACSFFFYAAFSSFLCLILFFFTYLVVNPLPTLTYRHV